MTEDSNMTIDDFKKMYYSNDDNPEKKRMVLFEMAAIYRSMIEYENRLINDRTKWFLSLNGFLFAALGIMLASGKVASGFLICVSFVFAALGCVLALRIFREGILVAFKASRSIQDRWKEFLNTFFNYPISNLNNDFYVPLIIGYTDENPPIDDSKNRRDYEPRYVLELLARVMASAWIVLFVVVFSFNVLSCLPQSVADHPSSSCASQGDSANSAITDYSSVSFKLETSIKTEGKPPR